MISFAASAAAALLTATWQGFLLAFAVVLCLRLAPKLAAAARSLIWSAAFALLMLLHFAPALASRSAALTPGAPAHALHFDSRWSLALVAVWAACSLFRALQLLRSALFLRRLAGLATPISAPGLLAQSPRAVQLCTSPEIDRPSVVGFFSPRILLPPGLVESLTPAELQQVLLHELEHLRRRDDWTNLLQKLALVLFPLNPVLLWVERRLCMERELACDDRVLRQTAAPKAYATCLVRLAEHTLVRRGLSLALGALGSGKILRRPSELTRRVSRILSQTSRGLSSRQTFALVATLLVAITGASLKLARSPQFISFRPMASSTSPEAVITPGDGAARSAHLVLAKAVLPESSSRPRNNRPRLTQLRTAHLRRPASQRWFLLTNFEQSGYAPAAIQARYTVTVAETFSYAAVPTRNGWLLVPLQPRIVNLEL